MQLKLKRDSFAGYNTYPPLSAPSPITTRRPSAFLTIFSAGIAAGILDITAAFVSWAPRGIRPVQTALLGAALHFLIAFSAAGVFYGASRKLIFLRRRPILSGVLYGIVVYLFMYWVVMPLSAYHKPPFSISATIIAIVTHIVCVGLPISLVVGRYSNRWE
jgi:hypothetical protein